MKVKLRLYVAGVASVLVYGSECWDLAGSTCSAVRAWNARRLATLTGRSIKEEYEHPTHDLLGGVRRRRLKWLGDLLRAEESFLPRRVALTELARFPGKGHPGGIFMDAPRAGSVEELVELARDKARWAKFVKNI